MPICLTEEVLCLPDDVASEAEEGREMAPGRGEREREGPLGGWIIGREDGGKREASLRYGMHESREGRGRASGRGATTAATAPPPTSPLFFLPLKQLQELSNTRFLSAKIGLMSGLMILFNKRRSQFIAGGARSLHIAHALLPHLVADLGWIDFVFGFSAFSQILAVLT